MDAGAAEDVTDFSKVVGSDSSPNLPKFDPNRAVRASNPRFIPKITRW
jgi:peroxisomal enoyl-CoA hydratase 2